MVAVFEFMGGGVFMGVRLGPGWLSGRLPAMFPRLGAGAAQVPSVAVTAEAEPNVAPQTCTPIREAVKPANRTTGEQLFAAGHRVISKGGFSAGWKPAFQDGQDGHPPTCPSRDAGAASDASPWSPHPHGLSRRDEAAAPRAGGGREA